jgi:glutamyl-Q tRNA(Asp) synthetase
MASSQYRGRFAPSPTGPLHFGSLIAAVGSYLDAKHHHGTWLVRMEDLDTPRCVPGAAEDILRTLEAYGLYWDEKIIYQSQRTAAYEAALQQLKGIGAAYPCGCTRKEIADSALHGIEGYVYPGTCRNGLAHERASPAWRVRTDRLSICHSRTSGNDSLPDTEARIEFDDALQGHISQHLETEIGDFVVKRADGLFAYQLAVVADDAFQGITHVVRGADLLASTPRQIHLQHLLGLPTPHYLHFPVAVNEAGEKLSKQTLAPAINARNVLPTLIEVLEFLQQQPPNELSYGSIEKVLGWAISHWQPQRLANVQQITYPAHSSR